MPDHYIARVTCPTGYPVECARFDQICAVIAGGTTGGRLRRSDDAQTMHQPDLVPDTASLKLP
jgi:hypothetical protein